MARRQLEIAGTRTDKDPPLALVEAGEELIEQKRTVRREQEKVKEKYVGVIAVMQANEVPHFEIKDPDTGEYLEFDLELVPKLTITKKGEMDTPIGTGIPTEAPSDEPHAGLIAQALKAQEDMNVEENSDGDVTVPDAAAPKKNKRKGRKKS